MTAPNALRVLLIGGWGRCGSTLLDMLLGQVPRLFSAGEIRELWLRGCIENRPCSCGEPFLDCPFWKEVGKQAFGGWQSLDLDDLLQTRYSVDRPWGIPQLLAPRLPPRRAAALARYRERLSQLFRAISAVSGASVVIDSSKLPSHALLMSQISDLDVRMVHLVRDSRGVAYSCQKRVEKRVTTGQPTYLPQHGPIGASARYVVYNGLTASLGSFRVMPYLRLRYEDLISHPGPRMRDVLAHIDEPADREMSFLASREATLADSHMVEGNPVRFTKGGLTLRRDEEWRTRLSVAHRLVVTTLTLPMIATYNYPVRGILRPDGPRAAGAAGGVDSSAGRER